MQEPRRRRSKDYQKVIANDRKMKLARLSKAARLRDVLPSVYDGLKVVGFLAIIGKVFEGAAMAKEIALPSPQAETAFNQCSSTTISA